MTEYRLIGTWLGSRYIPLDPSNPVVPVLFSGVSSESPLDRNGCRGPKQESCQEMFKKMYRQQKQNTLSGHDPGWQWGGIEYMESLIEEEEEEENCHKEGLGMWRANECRRLWIRSIPAAINLIYPRTEVRVSYRDWAQLTLFCYTVLRSTR